MIATITEETENDEQVMPEFTDHPIPEFSELNIDVSVTPIGTTPDSRDWQTLKQTQGKAANLENIIKTLSSPVKKGVIKNVVDSDTVDEILAYTHAEDLFQATISYKILATNSSFHVK